jgi:hypothetical protein
MATAMYQEEELSDDGGEETGDGDESGSGK